MTEANDKVYIHEFVDIIGHNRAAYMHHMTANWSPIAQDERNQQCYGVWGVVGTTRGWPQVVNLWEEDGFAGLARSFRHELGHASLQDPKLARWWSAAAALRSGGTDRVLVPASWTPTIGQLTAAHSGAPDCWAHEQVTVAPGTAADYLERARDEAAPAYAAHGWELVGGFTTAMRNDDEAFLLWRIPAWEQWGAAEAAASTDAALLKWRSRRLGLVEDFHRFLLVDAPLSPPRTGRQPRREDRTDWTDE
ncbi:hypothetical protein [Yinghuangia soli]|uniref:NIPSNAP family containing protein n=1 Tax=Yinghuangia soli TaxID=2908204 RepID=A0AA41PZF8_9ACTN|nr:hypothetical protein [Yinghuangia soli]MCF2527649.1 hypothetical protein [Yinghuangia soli]